MLIGKALDNNDVSKGIRDIVRAINKGIYPEAAADDPLGYMVREVKALVDCDHVFLSLVDSDGKVLRAAAWHSPHRPNDISLGQKFMWDKYSMKQTVLLNDLSQYNYRLHPSAARLQMQSVIGAPIIIDGEVAGVLEAYSDKTDMFSDIELELLTIYAKGAAHWIRQTEQMRQLEYLAAENRLLKLLVASEKLPVSDLLVRLGDLFKSALGVEGIAVLAVEGDARNPVLKAVMADSFPASSINRLITALTGEFLCKLAAAPEGTQERYLIKHSLTETGTKAVHIIPIAWRQRLHGLIVFYRGDTLGERNSAQLLGFIRQMMAHVGRVFERKHAYVHMQRLSLTDSLTGLANRRLFDFALEREFKRVKRVGKPLSLLMIDIDYFKKINDELGHVTGDTVLAEFGRLLADSFRGTDIAVRYGGEEFAIILPETGRSEAMMIAERLREDVAAREFSVANQQLKITVSIGSATHNVKGEVEFPNAETMVWAADQALYRAKQLGRNLTIVWSG